MMARMTDDPAGHYTVLDVAPDAAPEEIAAAYRRKARVLHPDVPGTGDTGAFIRVKAAYDELSDPGRRARYDRAARSTAAPQFAPRTMERPPRGPRISDVPVFAWLALGGLFCVAAVMAVIQFQRPAPPRSEPVIRPFAPPGPGMSVAVPTQPLATSGGPTTHYVLPTGDATLLWRRNAGNDAYVPAGHIGDFTPVRALRLDPRHGLVEIALAGADSGYIDAARLAPGDRMAARRAYCAFNAGPAPGNGEVLARQGGGAARIEINNRASQPAVVKLRDANGRAAATVFVGPGDRTTLADLPDTAYRPDFAIGELWSRACNDFAAGTRAQRFAGYASPAGLSPLVIPPDLSVGPAPVDISDAEFEGE